ncbi:MAG: hypothetical protein Q4A21_03490 [bacterium]|nr:hypothetical protein [bacterium]
MNSKNKKIIFGLVLIVASFMNSISIFSPIKIHNNVYAEEAPKDGGSGGSGNSSAPGGPSTAVLPDDWKIEDILNMILTTITIGIGVSATLSIVIAGVIYATAAGDSGKVSKAKTMIMNTVIGLVAYAFMWAFLQWLIPGGVF